MAAEICDLENKMKEMNPKSGSCGLCMLSYIPPCVSFLSAYKKAGSSQLPSFKHNEKGFTVLLTILKQQ